VKSQHFNKALLSKLRHAIDCTLLKSLASRNRCYKNNMSGLASRHLTKDFLREQKRSFEICLKNVVDIFLGELQEITETSHTSIVDQTINPTESLGASMRRFPCLFRISEVQGLNLDLKTEPSPLGLKRF